MSIDMNCPVIKVDKEATYISFGCKNRHGIITTKINDLVNLDYNSKGELIGIEIVSPVEVKRND